MKLQKTDFTKPCQAFRPSEQDLKHWEKGLPELRMDKGLDSCMKVLACTAQSHKRRRRHLPAMACGLALDWLQSLKIRLERANASLGALQLIEFTECLRDSEGQPIHGTEQTKVLLYNQNTMSEQRALEILDSGMAAQDGRVAVLWPDQAAALFPDAYRPSRNKTEENS